MKYCEHDQYHLYGSCWPHSSSFSGSAAPVPLACRGNQILLTSTLPAETWRALCEVRILSSPWTLKSFDAGHPCQAALSTPPGSASQPYLFWLGGWPPMTMGLPVSMRADADWLNWQTVIAEDRHFGPEAGALLHNTMSRASPAPPAPPAALPTVPDRDHEGGTRWPCILCLSVPGEAGNVEQ
jgi:hypothetical protein